MSFALLQSALLLPAELLVNGLLVLDPLSVSRLRPLEGKLLRIHCTGPELDLYVRVNTARLHLSPVSGAEADATISGDAKALLGLLARGGSTHNLHGTGVELQGSTALVGGLRETLQKLDVDWEYQLSRVFGDLPARAAGSTAQAGADIVKRSADHLRDDLHNYVTREVSLVPDRREVEAYYGALQNLQLRLDRLQARIDLLSEGP